MDLVKELISAGADPDLSDNYGRTALMFAVAEENADCVQELLAASTNISIRGQKQSTAFIYAAARGNVNIVKALISAGVDVDGTTTLIVAVDKGHTDCAQELTAVDVDVNIRGKYPLSALICAAIIGNVDFCRS